MTEPYMTLLDLGVRDWSWADDVPAVAEAREDAEIDRLLAELRAGAVEPDMLLALCARRLDDLDQQIGELTTALQARTTRAEELGRELARMRETEMRFNEFENADGTYRTAHLADATEATIREWMTEWGFSEEEILARIEEMRPRMAETVDGFNLEDWRRITGNEHLLRTSDFDEAIAAIDGEMKRLNADNEMLMMKLQSAMQQRTSMVQMTTNMLKAIDEGVDAVVGNLR